MMNIFKSTSRRFASDKQGIAAIEFAMIAPIMLFMFFGLVELSDAIKAHKKVSSAANILADLTSQEKRIDDSEINDYFKAVEQVITPYGIEDAKMEIVSIVLDDSNLPKVAWSANNEGGQPYANGATYPDFNEIAEYSGGTANSFLHADSSLIISKVEYTFKSKLSNVRFEQLEFKEMSMRWPRKEKKIKMCTDTDDLDTCVYDVTS